MASVATYLNFSRETEQAFRFYKSVFGTEFVDGIHYMSEVPAGEGQPPLSEEDKHLVMNVTLPITAGHILMGTDAPESMGLTLIQGNNVAISIQPDSKEEADRLFNELSKNGSIEMPMQDMFWGDYYGSFTDQFGIRWMIDYSSKR